MSDCSQARTGGALLADALLALGADTVYCVPGESFLGFLDAAHDRADRLRVVSCRQEGGAAYMADAHGKLTGKPGVCFVTRGPGACNATVGIHTAFQDATPVLLFVGQVGRGMAGREAFQEVDMSAFFKPLAKFSATADRAERLPELVARAWAAATSGRPGPAVIAVPEDVLTEKAHAADPRPWPVPQAAPREADLDALAGMVGKARKPLVVVGGGTWTPDAARQVTAWAEACDLPVAAAFRRQDIVDNDSPSYVGDLGFAASPALNARLAEADLVIALGARLGEVDTQGYTLLASPQPDQALVHAFPDPAEIGRVYAPALGLVTGMEELVFRLPRVEGHAWAAWRASARADHEAFLTPDPCPGPLDLGAVMAEVQARLPPDAIVCNGAGNYSGWVHRFYRYRVFPSQLAPGNGSMGYGVPAAVAAQIAQPRRRVVAFAGDGCFLMNGQEIATAVAWNLPILVLVFNNGMYGTIRMHQERRYPGRVIATDLVNPDFAALARAYGAFGAVVEETRQVAPALDQALACGKPAVIELRVDPEVLSTRATLSGTRAQGLAQKAGGRASLTGKG